MAGETSLVAKTGSLAHQVEDFQSVGLPSGGASGGAPAIPGGRPPLQPRQVNGLLGALADGQNLFAKSQGASKKGVSFTFTPTATPKAQSFSGGGQTGGGNKENESGQGGGGFGGGANIFEFKSFGATPQKMTAFRNRQQYAGSHNGPRAQRRSANNNDAVGQDAELPGEEERGDLPRKRLRTGAVSTPPREDLSKDAGPPVEGAQGNPGQSTLTEHDVESVHGAEGHGHGDDGFKMDVDLPPMKWSGANPPTDKEIDNYVDKTFKKNASKFEGASPAKVAELKAGMKQAVKNQYQPAPSEHDDHSEHDYIGDDSSDGSDLGFMAPQDRRDEDIYNGATNRLAGLTAAGSEFELEKANMQTMFSCAKAVAEFMEMIARSIAR